MKEEKREDFEDNFQEIKEMQKTQELKKIEMEKEEVKEERKDSEKKGHPVFVTFLIILLLGVFTCMGFFGGTIYYKNSLEKDKREDKNSNTKSTTDKEWKDLGADLSKIKDVYDKLLNYTYKTNRLNGRDSFYEYDLLSLALVGINVQEAPLVGADGGGQSIYFISKESIENEIKKLFLNYKYDLTDDFLGSSFGAIGQYYVESYDKDKNGYNIKLIHTGSLSGPGPNITNRKVIGVYEKNNEIKVVEKVIYIDNYYNSDDYYYTIYKLPDETYIIGHVASSSLELSNLVISVDNYLDKAATITSYYKKDSDGNYKFVSSEITD